MQKLVTAIEWLIRLFLNIAMIALFVMMISIVADVFMRYVFNEPITGVYNLVEILLVVVVFFSTGTAIIGFHEIVIDLIDFVVPKAIVTLLKRTAALLSACVLIFVFVSMIKPAMQSHQYGEIKLELNIQVWIIWVIALVGLCGGILGSLVNVFKQLNTDNSSTGDTPIAEGDR